MIKDSAAMSVNTFPSFVFTDQSESIIFSEQQPDEPYYGDHSFHFIPTKQTDTGLVHLVHWQLLHQSMKICRF